MLTTTEGQVEREVLTDIYDSSNGAHWITITNWRKEGVSHCDWYGVTCDESYRTIKLDLNNNGLTGTLSKRIGELKSLRYLDLGNNKIKVREGCFASSNRFFLISSHICFFSL